MKREGVTLEWDAPGGVACRKMVEALRYHELQVKDLCVRRGTGMRWRGSVPLRLITRLGSSSKMEGDAYRDPRHLMGTAKKESALELNRQGLAAPGGQEDAGAGISRTSGISKQSASTLPNTRNRAARSTRSLFGSHCAQRLQSLDLIHREHALER